MIRLRLFHAKEPSRQIDQRMIGEDPVTIGRDPAADWVIVDPDRALSRRHCTVRIVGNAVVVGDLSANGTFVDEQAEPIGKGSEATVAPGGTIRLGPFTASVEALADLGAPAKPAPAAAPAMFDPPAGMTPVHEPGRGARIDPFASQLAADPLLADHKPTDRVALGAGDAWERRPGAHAGDWQAPRDQVDHEKLIGSDHDWVEPAAVEREAGFGFDAPFERPARAVAPPADEAIPADWAAAPPVPPSRADAASADAAAPPAPPAPEVAAAPLPDPVPSEARSPAKAKPRPAVLPPTGDGAPPAEPAATKRAGKAKAAEPAAPPPVVAPPPVTAAAKPPVPAPVPAPPPPPAAAPVLAPIQTTAQPGWPTKPKPAVEPTPAVAADDRWPVAAAPMAAVAADVAATPMPPVPEPGAAPKPTASPASPTAPDDPGTDDLFAAFCAGARLSPTSIPPAEQAAAMTRLGEIYRQMILGLADLMGERTALKNEYRLSRTMVRPEGNNPFKWVPPQRLALEVLRGGGDGFDDGGEAVVGSFRDVKTHIYCVLAGMRAAVDATFTALAPATIEAAAEPRSYLLKGQRDAALWADFTARFDRLRAEDADGAVNRAFSAAYEQQLAELDRRAARPGESRDSR